MKLMKRDLIDAINRRKIAIFGHSLQHNEFLISILEGKVLGKKRRGRPIKKILKYAQQIIKCWNYYKMKRVAEKREE